MRKRREGKEKNNQEVMENTEFTVPHSAIPDWIRQDSREIAYPPNNRGIHATYTTLKNICDIHFRKKLLKQSPPNVASLSERPEKE